MKKQNCNNYTLYLFCVATIIQYIVLGTRNIISTQWSKKSKRKQLYIAKNSLTRTNITMFKKKINENNYTYIMALKVYIYLSI